MTIFTWLLYFHSGFAVCILSNSSISPAAFEMPYDYALNDQLSQIRFTHRSKCCDIALDIGCKGASEGERWMEYKQLQRRKQALLQNKRHSEMNWTEMYCLRIGRSEIKKPRGTSAEKGSKWLAEWKIHWSQLNYNQFYIDMYWSWLSHPAKHTASAQRTIQITELK